MEAIEGHTVGLPEEVKVFPLPRGRPTVGGGACAMVEDGARPRVFAVLSISPPSSWTNAFKEATTFAFLMLYGGESPEEGLFEKLDWEDRALVVDVTNFRPKADLYDRARVCVDGTLNAKRSQHARI